MMRGDYAGARGILEGLIQTQPGSFWARVVFADILIGEARDAAMAEQALRAVLRLNPDYEPARRKLERLLKQHLA
jgi:predicted Zn-dependent protease